LPSRWKPALPPIPWRDWFDQGFGFLVLALIHMVGMSMLGSLERRGLVDADPEEVNSTRSRFFLYRTLLRLATIASTATLALWLTRSFG
jgi:hypothetical protein